MNINYVVVRMICQLQSCAIKQGQTDCLWKKPSMKITLSSHFLRLLQCCIYLDVISLLSYMWSHS